MIEYYGDAPREVGALIEKYCRKKKRSIPPSSPYYGVLRKYFACWIDFQIRGPAIIVETPDGTIRAKTPTELRKKLEGNL